MINDGACSQKGKQTFSSRNINERMQNVAKRKHTQQKLVVQKKPPKTVLFIQIKSYTSFC